MGRQQQMLQLVETSQWWADLCEEEKNLVRELFTKVREVIQSSDGCFWVARIIQRTGIWMSMDKEGDPDPKWLRAQAKLEARGYTMDRVVEEAIFFFDPRAPGGEGTGQFLAVYKTLNEKVARLGNLDVTKLNPRVLRVLLRGREGAGDGHGADCPASTNAPHAHCNCGWREIEQRVAELMPMRGAIAVATGLRNMKYVDAQGNDRKTDDVYRDLNSIGDAIEAIEKLPEGKPIVQFPDGTKWVILDAGGDSYEGKLMSHCGNVGGASSRPEDRLISYRAPSTKFIGLFEPKLTFIITPQGHLGEMKGKANKKPDEEYHPAIVELLKQPIIKGLTGEHSYLEGNNFSINDLDDDLLMDLYTARPDLIKFQLTHGDAYQRLSPSKWRKIQELSGKAPAKEPKKPSVMIDPESEENPLPD